MEGKVALEVFTAVTKTPRGLNYESNEGNSGNIFWLGWRSAGRQGHGTAARSLSGETV
jgi:hypothetical protein